MKTWDEKLALYDQLVAANPKFECKGKTVPYTSANGYMFSLINKDGDFGIKLPKASYQEFMDTFHTTVFKSHGAVMKEFVLVPQDMLENQKLLGPYLDESFNYVMSLKPK